MSRHSVLKECANETQSMTVRLLKLPGNASAAHFMCVVFRLPMDVGGCRLGEIVVDHLGHMQQSTVQLYLDSSYLEMAVLS